jgi:hypothetical protein
MYKMHAGKDGLSGCARISIQAVSIKVLEFDLGCFKISSAEDENMREGGSQNKHVLPSYDQQPLMVFLRHMIKKGQYDSSEEIAAFLMQGLLKEDSLS